MMEFSLSFHSTRRIKRSQWHVVHSREVPSAKGRVYYTLRLETGIPLHWDQQKCILLGCVDKLLTDFFTDLSKPVSPAWLYQKKTEVKRKNMLVIIKTFLWRAECISSQFFSVAWAKYETDYDEPIRLQLYSKCYRYLMMICLKL